MTLFRQLIIAVILLFFTLYAVNISISVTNNSALISEQMKIHAQDTATSLGLSMTQAAVDRDTASLETMFNAISDSGYFQRIIFKDLTGKVVVERKFPVNISGVPGWFVDLIKLPSYQGLAKVSAGWEQLGTLTVTSHPGQAYLKLWQITLTQLSWFAVVTLLVCLFAALGLRWLLGPLQRVEAQANAIVERRFEVQPLLPKTRELRRVVEAMNRMSSKLSSLFDEQVALIGRLREQSTLDPVTKLSNRQDFDAQLTCFITPETGPRSGALFIISVEDIAKINDYAGREECNAVLVNVGLAITDVINQFEGCLIARRQGADFTVFLPDVEQQEAEQLALNAFDQVKGVTWQHQETHPLVFHMGLTYNGVIEAPQSLLNEADIALKKAILNGPNQWCKFAEVEQGEAPVLSKPAAQWRAYLEESIAKRNIELHMQPVFAVSGKESLKEKVAAETFVRFPSEGNLLPAGVVIPLAEKLGLMVSLEKLIIELAIERLADSDTELVLNLSAVSLRSEDFLTWLDDTLNASHSNGLHFEVSEHSMHTSVSQVEQLNKILFKHNAKLGIDHFGLEASSFSYLSRLSLAYLKVHRSFVTDLQSNTDNQFYIQMLGNLAKSLDIQIWVEGVESQEDFDILDSLGVDMAQGYFLGAPE